MGRIEGHHIAMLFASQFRNLAAGEVLVVRSNSLIARCAQDSLMRLVDAKKMALVAESFQPRLTGLLGIQGRRGTLTEKNLAGYRRAQQEPGGLDAASRR